MKSNIKKIILIIVIVILVIGIVCFYNLNKGSLYKPNGKIEYNIVYVLEETNPYYQIGFSDYVFIGKVVKENKRYLFEDMPRTTYQIKVLENLKGNLQDNIEVIYPGGYYSDGTLILEKGDEIIDESLPDIDSTYIFVGIGQQNGEILLQTLYTDTIYNQDNKEKFLDYINNSEDVTRNRFKSKYEK